MTHWIIASIKLDGAINKITGKHERIEALQACIIPCQEIFSIQRQCILNQGP